jgi:hypothetical protein
VVGGHLGVVVARERPPDMVICIHQAALDMPLSSGARHRGDTGVVIPFCCWAS